MKFKEILKRQQEILSFAKAQGRDLTAEESAEFNKLEKDLENLAKEEEDETAKRALDARGLMWIPQSSLRRILPLMR